MAELIGYRQLREGEPKWNLGKGKTLIEWQGFHVSRRKIRKKERK